MCCGCGCMEFIASQPHPDEWDLALQLYEEEIEKSNLYTKIAQEVVNDWRAGRPNDFDKPSRIRIYSK